MGDLQQRKYRQWFQALDVDDDGTLTRRDIAPFDRDGDDCVDLKEMTASFQQTLDDPARYSDQIQPIANHYFDLADIDSNDRINLQEFTQIFSIAARVSDEDCADVFRQLDLDDSDGRLPN